MRLRVLFVTTVALMVVALMPVAVALAQEASPVRVLPNTVEKGAAFNRA